MQAYRRTRVAELEPFGEAWPTGEATCHVAADPQGRFIIATCWGDGQVILFELDDDGAITSRFSAEAAVDPHHNGPTDQPRPSRAHSSLMLPDGRILTADLGNDLVRVWTYQPGSGLQADHQVVLPKGSGPRHMVRHSSGTVFVNTEYSLEVAAIRSEPQGVFELTAMVPVSVNKPFDGDAAAEIALSPDGRFAYVGVRGSNRMCILKVSAEGTSLEPGGRFHRRRLATSPLGSRRLAAGSARGVQRRHELQAGPRLRPARWPCQPRGNRLAERAGACLLRRRDDIRCQCSAQTLAPNAISVLVLGSPDFDVVRAADEPSAARLEDHPQELVLGNIVHTPGTHTPRNVIDPHAVAGLEIGPLRRRNVPVAVRPVEKARCHDAAGRRRHTVGTPLWAGRTWPSVKTCTVSGSESGLHKPEAGQWEPVGMTRVARSRRRAMLFIVETRPWVGLALPM